MDRYHLKELISSKVICIDQKYNIQCEFIKHHYERTWEMVDLNPNSLDFQQLFTLRVQMKEWLLKNHFRKIY